MNHQIARLAAAAVIGAALALPGAAFAADPEPAPPAAVTDWQAHLDHMRSMDGTLGGQVRGCIELHDSMAGMFGPSGSMVEMMGGGMLR